MTEVYLHGILAKKFKEKYILDVSQPEDIFVAIDSNSPRFITFLQNNVDKMNLSVLVNKKVVTDPSKIQSDLRRIDLIPTCEGSAISLLGWFLISLVVSVGIAYLQAASSITPPENDSNSEQSVKTRSFEFSGEINLEKQGKPVPVGYGRLRVGSYVVGNQIWNRNLFNQVKS